MPISGRAVKIRGAGDVDVLSIDDHLVRDPGHGEVLVAVAAAGLNRADCLQRRGVYPAPAGSAPDVPGLEFAGTVAAIGDGVNGVRVGDRVMGIVGGGGMATHVVTHERAVVPVPQGMALDRAAAIPEVFFTAYDAMFTQAKLGIGETILVHAVASGIGTAVIQLARAVGATSIGTSRTPAKLARCTELGLDRGVAMAEGKLPDDVRADVILDMVGGNYLEQDLRAIRPRGRIVIVGLLAGATAQLNLGAVLNKRATIIGTVLRSRSLEEKAALSSEIAHRLIPLFESGSLQPVIDQVMPIADVRKAHQLMERNDTFGKLVLAW
jgi:putative PIG3 family NAD(P)H quinone oxidoreductase